MPTAFWGTLQIQHQRGGQVRAQREVPGHLQEAGELQEDEDLVRRAVQLGSWGPAEGDQGEKQENVRTDKVSLATAQMFFSGSRGQMDLLGWKQEARR